MKPHRRPPSFRNSKRNKRIRRQADNPFTKHTGIEIHRLTGEGACDCHLAFQAYYNRIPVRKLAFAIHDGWQRYELGVTGQKMKNLRVKQTCKVDQCVNPEHLIGKVLPPMMFGMRSNSPVHQKDTEYRPPSSTQTADEVLQ